MTRLETMDYKSLGRKVVVVSVALAFLTLSATAQVGLVTAVRANQGNLKLISWSVASNGQITRLADASAGAVSLISSARLHAEGGGKLVTAVRDGGGNLKVIAWEVDSSGVIQRRGSAQAGAVSKISATAIANQFGNRFVTAVRESGGNLKVIAWTVTANGQISRDGDALAGAVSRISATFVGSSGTLLATAVRDSGGNLKVITWRVSSGGQVTRLADASAGAVSQISAVGVGETLLVTAVRDSGGNLKLIAWEVAESGRLTRLGDGLAGAVTRISGFYLGGPRLATAVRDSGGNLKIITWSVLSTSTTGRVARLGDASAGAVSGISAFAFGNSGIQTAVRDSGGNLKIIAWQTTPDSKGITRLGDASAGAVSLISTTGGNF